MAHKVSPSNPDTTPADIQAIKVPEASDHTVEAHSPSQPDRWLPDYPEGGNPPPDRFYPIGCEVVKLAKKMMSNLDPNAAADVKMLAKDGSDGALEVLDEERPLRLTQAKLLQAADGFTDWVLSRPTAIPSQIKEVKQIAADLNTMAAMKLTVAKTELDGEDTQKAKKIELLADQCKKDAKELRNDGRKSGRRSMTPLEKIHRHFDQLAAALAEAKQPALSKRVRSIQREFEAANRPQDGTAEPLH